MKSSPKPPISEDARITSLIKAHDSDQRVESYLEKRGWVAVYRFANPHAEIRRSGAVLRINGSIFADGKIKKGAWVAAILAFPAIGLVARFFDNHDKN
jgi:hypothetical protein